MVPIRFQFFPPTKILKPWNYYMVHLLISSKHYDFTFIPCSCTKFQTVFEGNQNEVNKTETLLCQHFFLYKSKSGVIERK